MTNNKHLAAGAARNNFLLVLFFVASFCTAQANAVQISAGDTFDVDWFVDLDDAVATGDLSITSSWQVTQFTNSSIVFDVTVTNTSSIVGSSAAASTLMTIGLGLEPNVIATLISPGNHLGLIEEASSSGLPGFRDVDFCIVVDRCIGGSVADGLWKGDSDTFQLALSGTFVDSIDLAVAVAKIQSSVGSFYAEGTTSITTQTQPQPVSEPPILGLLGLGLLGLGLRRRRQPQLPISLM